MYKKQNRNNPNQNNRTPKKTKSCKWLKRKSMKQKTILISADNLVHCFSAFYVISTFKISFYLYNINFSFLSLSSSEVYRTQHTSTIELFCYLFLYFSSSNTCYFLIRNYCSLPLSRVIVYTVLVLSSISF